MTKNQPPGSDEFRALIQPFIDKGEYPEPREFEDGEAEALPEATLKIAFELHDLLEEEKKIANWGTLPTKRGPWAKKRQEICDKLRELLTLDIKLIEIDLYQEQGVEKGAIPDLREENGGGKYYRTADHYLAHWVCGTNIMQKEVDGEMVPWCTTCDMEPATQLHYHYHPGLVDL